jgi:hypothetical protein
MKYIITESQSNDAMSNLLKKLGIKIDVSYWQDNSYDTITGSVYLYKNKEILGYRHGYEFYYKYDPRFDTLKYEGRWPSIDKLDLFKFMPSDMVIKYFSDRVEKYLRKYIDDGYTTLRPKKKI